MNENGDGEHAQLYARLAASVPEHIWRSTVALVAIRGETLHQHGTGTLLGIGEYSFIVTAAHVVKRAKASHIGLCVTTGDQSFVQPSANWTCSAEGQYGTSDDPFDVAVVKLNDKEAKRFESMSLLRLHDVSFAEPLRGSLFTVFGYPEVWSSASVDDATRLMLKPLQYTTYEYEGRTTALGNYQPRFHLLLDGEISEARDCRGSPVRFSDFAAYAVRRAADLGGISGGSVWNIGDPEIPLSDWTNLEPKMVAVETSTYNELGIIKATRWVAVSTLLHSAYPEVRSAFDLWYAK